METTTCVRSYVLGAVLLVSLTTRALCSSASITQPNGYTSKWLKSWTDLCHPTDNFARLDCLKAYLLLKVLSLNLLLLRYMLFEKRMQSRAQAVSSSELVLWGFYALPSQRAPN